MKRQTNILGLCIAIVMWLLLLSGDLFARDFCPSNAHGFHLTVGDDTLVETTISEQNRKSGSVCELQNLSDGALKVTLFARKTFKEDIYGTSLEQFLESYLKVYRKTFSSDVAILDKKEVFLPMPGYQLIFRSDSMKCLIVLYSTVKGGLEYFVAFTFPVSGKDRYMPLVQDTIKGLSFTSQIPLVLSMNTTPLSFLDLNLVKIPYPKGWQVYSAENVEELKRSEVDDHLYSKLIINEEATYVFKSKYENEQLFTMTLAIIPKPLDLDRLYPDVRRQVNALFQRDYGPDYTDKSLGRIVIKERPYYNFTFETSKSDHHSVLYEFWFVNRGLIYVVKFKTPTALFQTLKRKMDEVIEQIEY
ncbi:MAG: hypothetical protein ABR903_05675 [Thermodesulfovibrionales bacterium]|jgi:hypothetical protein